MHVSRSSQVSLCALGAHRPDCTPRYYYPFPSLSFSNLTLRGTWNLEESISQIVLSSARFSFASG